MHHYTRAGQKLCPPHRHRYWWLQFYRYHHQPAHGGRNSFRIPHAGTHRATHRATDIELPGSRTSRAAASQRGLLRDAGASILVGAATGQ
jgi:hypothetical protein